MVPERQQTPSQTAHVELVAWITVLPRRLGHVWPRKRGKIYTSPPQTDTYPASNTSGATAQTSSECPGDHQTKGDRGTQTARQVASSPVSITGNVRCQLEHAHRDTSVRDGTASHHGPRTCSNHHVSASSVRPHSSPWCSAVGTAYHGMRPASSPVARGRARPHSSQHHRRLPGQRPERPDVLPSHPASLESGGRPLLAWQQRPVAQTLPSRSRKPVSPACPPLPASPTVPSQQPSPCSAQQKGEHQ